MGVQTQTKITKTKILTRCFLTEKYKYKRDEDKYNIIVNKGIRDAGSTADFRML